MYFWDGLLGPVSGTPDSYIVDRALPLPERALIERIRRRLGRRSLAVVAGIGDDCAVLRVRPGHQALVTTDLSLEGIHFRREWHPPESVGHRCLARGLSDIAAMGGEPIAVFLSLAVPGKLPQSWVIDISDGLSTDLRRICEESGVGAEIEKALIPVARIGRARQPVDVRFALHGGEDYELLFTTPAAKRIPARIGGVPIAEIGCITRGKKILIRNAHGGLSELSPQGWEHFRT